MPDFNSHVPTYTDTIKVHQLTLGYLDTHCYIIGDVQTHEAIIIDPAFDAPQILAVVASEGWSVKQILATHCHFDHIMALNDVKTATHAPFLFHHLDLPIWERYARTVTRYTQLVVPQAVPADRFIEAGEIITQGAIMLEARFTPGHAPGHLAFVCHSLRAVFGGDVLFHGAVGRWDLPESDREALFNSITTQLLSLPDDYQLLAGHMDNSTIGTERRTNPYVVEWLETHAR